MTKKTNPPWERISRIIHHYKFPTVTSFTHHIGLNRGENIYRIKRGSNGISRELAERISAHFPELSKAWILTGEGGMLPDAETDAILKQIACIPFYYNFPATRPPDDPDKFLYFSKELIADADFAVSCRTDELYPVHKKDAVLFLRRWSMKDPMIYGETYFIITAYCRVFRTIRSTENAGQVSLESINQEKYDRITIPQSDILELYIVVH